MTGTGTEAAERSLNRQTAYAELIVHVMHHNGVTKNQLFRNGVIRKCTQRDFEKRLYTGDISAAELNNILEYLEIDPIRADLAISCFDDPDAYHNLSCDTVSRFSRETVKSLWEHLSACDGNFEPLRESLCSALAQRTSIQIIEQHHRTQEWEASQARSIINC